MQSNFQFLEQKWPMLADLGKLAEKNIYQDSNTTLIKLGMFAELMVDYMFAYDNLEDPDNNSQLNKIRILKQNDLLPYEIDQILHTLRVSRNKAAHENYSNVEDAKINTSLAFKLATWFMQIYGDWNFEPMDFVLPVKNNEKIYIEKLKNESEKLTLDYENKLHKLQIELNQLRSQKTDEGTKERQEKSAKAASLIKLNEDETRKIIDEQLRSCGWEADTKTLRFSNGTRPQKNKNLAIAEWPTKAIGSRKSGRADYALFVGVKLVALIEAKRGSKDIPSDIEDCKDYAKKIKEEDSEYVINTWGEYKVPFLFATNGRKYLKQLEEKSGIWFLDARNSTNHPKALQSWYTPRGLKDLLDKDIRASTKSLEEETFEYLTDSKGLNLRKYQINAIKAMEDAIANGKENILISMATGTGKTRTILGLAYRLIKTNRFKRILFLVDRQALGNQTEDAFKETTIEDLQTFGEIYDIKGLDEKSPELTTKLHIATVQGMVKRIMYSEGEVPPIDNYDCIIVDEAHRGYLLDKEMGEVELEFRNQDDYISKYRNVLEYFDATKIALTATPALHTTAIFGKPVFKYTYAEAVVDGYLVDHGPPFQIVTKLSKEGINYKVGNIVPIYDPITNKIVNSERLPDDLNIEIDHFNKKVLNENFNRVALEQILDHISPIGREKTLIFAATDNHADMVVRLIKEIYENRGIEVEDDAIMKITGSIKDPLLAIKRFKNEENPTIVVTVDLLTTGIDVPEICNLVFLRRVKSRILYEQMLGRATRLCDDIEKTHFNIFDAVRLYEGLEKVTNMKPVVARNSIKFKELIDELLQLDTEEKKKNHIDGIIAKFHRNKRKLKGEKLEEFKLYTKGKTPDEFIDDLRKGNIKEIVEKIEKNKELFSFLDEHEHNPRKIIISTHEDKLLEASEGYGKSKKPEDYLEEFGEFINDNINKISALQIVCQRPQELTRTELKSLLEELYKHGFSEIKLNIAYNQMTDADITADIIGFIRQQAIGSALIDHEERIKNAMKKVKGLQKWTKVQLQWLERIEKQLLKESIIDKESFDIGAFRTNGGFDRINKHFGGKLEELIKIINENLYDERGTA
ncbi:MAG: type I restriction-modification system endonuclease [Clostridiaceae bacterium]|nr:type I restriction-modification system endonuclease [Clostridiaceae bacterium]MBW4859761.1 type I restriction-modification system endonuclease [Clostridiaceae bacterium]MBW4869809.1 type I restriction-modification system endonuclease [Clostridiaceae bacterium]